MTPEWRRRLLIVDDDPLMSRLLRDALDEAGFDIHTASTIATARAALIDFDPDIALVDLEMGAGPSGVDLARAIHQLHPGVGIVILTRYADLPSAGYEHDALPPGTGFLHKDRVHEPGLIVAAIDAVVAERTGEARHDLHPVEPFPELTRAQREVLSLMAEGYGNEAIAAIRGCSRSSIANLILGIYRRLGIDPRGDLHPRVEAVRRFSSASGLPDRPPTP